jgi:U3 small nucleolar RNA-associated protein 12
MGYNLAALKYLKGRYEGEKVAGLWDEDAVRDKMAERKASKAKRKRIEVRA